MNAPEHIRKQAIAASKLPGYRSVSSEADRPAILDEPWFFEFVEQIERSIQAQFNDEP